ncbi:MAG: hypothetical protein ACR2N8_02475, partial [Parvibaculales bacterium]
MWRSLDGRSWDLVKASGGDWVQRHSHQAFSLDGRLYLMGGTANSSTGFPNNSRLNDVWSSADDGVTWTMLGNPWTGRIGFGALAFPPNLVLHGTTNDVITVSLGLTPEIYTVTARDGYTAEPYAYSMKPKVAGFDINSDGVLAVAEDAEGGLHMLTLQATDGEGTQAETIVRVDVHALQIVDVPPITILGRLPVAVTLTTLIGAFGQGTYTYNLVGGDYGRFALGETSGVLSVPSNPQGQAGSFDLLVEVADGVPRRATAVVQVRLVPNKMFMMGGIAANFDFRKDVWSSSLGGKNWEFEGNANWAGRSYSQAVSHNDRMYVLGGFAGGRKNDVWSSVDAKNWSFEGNADWTARYWHQAVSYSGRLWVLGGSAGSGRKNDVWSSVDAKNWEFEGNADWPARHSHQAVSHMGRLYVMGGDLGSSNNGNDVWSSWDGKNWEFVGNAGWAARESFEVESHNGRLYVIAGSREAAGRNDVWSSVDGKDWSQEQADGSNFWSRRYNSESLSYEGFLYVLGGQVGIPGKSDVWSSANGKSWTETTANAWPSRYSHMAVVFPQPLVLPAVGELFILSVGVAEAGIATVTAQNGFGEYTYSFTPRAGFTFDSDSRVLSEDGSSPRGTYLLTVRVTDEEREQAETVIRVDVYGLFMEAPPPIFLYGGEGTPAISLHTFVATEGVAPYIYALKDIPGAGRDAARFSIGATSGVLSSKLNIPARTYNIGVEATDKLGRKVQVNVKVTAEPVLSLTDAPPANLFSDEIGATVTVHTFAAGGGIGAKVYNIVSGNVGGYFAVDRNSGVLAGVNVPLGAYTLSVRVRDSRNSEVVAQAVVRILEPFLSTVPPLVFLPPKSMSVTLYNFTGGSVGKKGYVIFSGNDQGYFDLGEESGILSAKPNTPAGTYDLILFIVDTGTGRLQQPNVKVHLVDNGIFVLGGNDGGFRNDVWLAAADG